MKFNASLDFSSTEDLMRELIARFEAQSLSEEFESSLNFLRAATLKNILFGMVPGDRGFRAVDS
jgi:hypothetical protein